MSAEAGWLTDPSGTHELRYWSGSEWTEHVADQGTTGVDPVREPLPPPAPPAAVPPPPPPGPSVSVGPDAGVQPEGAVSASAAAPSGKGGWKDKLKNAAQQAAQQGQKLADQAKTQIGEQQQKRLEQAANDPNTLWFGDSKNPATKATGMSKAFYRITKDRIWIDSGLLGVKSDSVPLWAVRDLDVRQTVLQRGKDIGDVVLWLEDPTLAADPTGMFNMTGMSEPGARTSGEVLLDNIEGPYQVRDLLIPLVSEARAKKLQERQTQYIVNPMMQQATMAAPPAPPAAPTPAPEAPKVDLAEELRKLATLRDEGILTDEEFAAQKAKLLGG